MSAIKYRINGRNMFPWNSNNLRKMNFANQKK